MKEHIPDDPVRGDGGGRVCSDQREVLDAINWIHCTRAPWEDLPERFPPYQPVQRRFQNWREAVVMQEILRALARDLYERGGLDLSECFMDTILSSAKKGAISSARPAAIRKASLSASNGTAAIAPDMIADLILIWDSQPSRH